MTETVAVARVATATPLPELFDYAAPNTLKLGSGDRVRVPLGRRHVVGIVVDVQMRDSAHRLKAVQARLDAGPILPPDLMDLAAFAASYYQHAPGPAYLGLLPTALRHDSSLVLPRRESICLIAPAQGRITPRQRDLIELLGRERNNLELDELLPGWRVAATQLKKRGIVAISRGDAVPRNRADGPLLALNPGQAAACAAVDVRGGFRGALLDGVTGSGKTEVYLHLISQVLAQGNQALYLVPEIGLTPQLTERIRSCLSGRIAVLHSQLSDGERALAWLAAGRGEVDLVVGTRSALFAPLPKLGLIIVDEEHDTSFKQHEGLRFHARDLALKRAQLRDVPIVLGSATPALETLRNALSGRLLHLHLPLRALSTQQTRLELVDVRSKRLDEGLSDTAIKAIGATLARGEQVLVFRNQRGFSPSVQCHDCGWHSGCKHCSARLTLHRQIRRLVCHHCGHQEALPPACPECGSLGVRPIGEGTERLEEGLKAKFGDTPILRVDRDSTANKGSFAALLARAERGDPCILVGTQMLAKGHHLPKISLVVIVSVDSHLFSPDLRAPERLAQLLTQVAGRAGRAEAAGTVLLQSHHPSHPLLDIVLSQGYGAAARQLLAERELAGLPPFAAAAALQADAVDRDALQQFMVAAEQSWRALKISGVDSSGAIPAAMERRAGRWRAQILLNALQRGALQRALSLWRTDLSKIKAGAVRWTFDVDPISL